MVSQHKENDFPTLSFYIVEAIIHVLQSSNTPLSRREITEKVGEKLSPVMKPRSLQRWLLQMAAQTNGLPVNGPIIEYIKDGDKYKLTDEWKMHRRLSDGQSLAIFMADKYLKAFSPINQDHEWRQLVHRASQQITHHGNLSQRFALLPEYMPFVTSDIHQKSMKVLPLLHEAITQSRSLTFSYVSARHASEQTRQTYTVAPIGLWQQGVRWYLAGEILNGAKHKQGSSPTFAVVRMANATLGDICDQKVPTLTEYLSKHDGFGKAGQLEGMIQIQLKILDPVMEDILSETPISADQTIRGNVLTATIRLSKQSYYWLQSCADSLEVLAPPSLRAQLRESFTNAALRYQQTKQGE